MVNCVALMDLPARASRASSDGGTWSGRARRGAPAALPWLGLVVAALMCPAPALASAYVAAGTVGQEFYGAGPPGVSNVGPTGATFTQKYVTDDINLVSNAASHAGNLSLFSLASINGMTNWSSGHVWSRASAGIIESVAPNWAPWLNDAETLTFDYEFSVFGNLSATSGGWGAAGGDAGLTYGYRLGDSNGGGTWTLESNGRVTQTGVWNGVISSAFTVHKNSNFNLELVASASATGSKTYAPGSDTTIVSTADFSHTLTWLGITGMHAFDSLGNEIALPPGAMLPLIGVDSGVDYWYSAAPSVPEPATALLFGCGLVVAGLARRSVVRRSDS